MNVNYCESVPFVDCRPIPPTVDVATVTAGFVQVLSASIVNQSMKELVRNFQKACSLSSSKTESEAPKKEQVVSVVSPYAEYEGVNLEGRCDLVAKIFSKLFNKTGSLDFSKLPVALTEKLQKVAHTITSLDLHKLDLSNSDLVNLSIYSKHFEMFAVNAKHFTTKDMQLFVNFYSLKTLVLCEAIHIGTKSIKVLNGVTDRLRKLKIMGSQLARDSVPTEKARAAIDTIFAKKPSLILVQVDDIGLGRPELEDIEQGSF